MAQYTVQFHIENNKTFLTCNELGVAFRIAEKLSAYGDCKCHGIPPHVELVCNAAVTKEQVQDIINEQLNPEVVELTTD